MAGPTRRDILRGALALGATAVIPSAAFAQSVRQSDAGNTLFKAANEHLYGNKTARSLRRTVKIDTTAGTIEGLKTADQIEEAFTKAWNEVSDSPFAKDLIQEAHEGNTDKLRYLTTDDGGGDYSVTSYMKTVFDEYAITAAEEAKNGTTGSPDFNAVQDRGLQAFLLNVCDQPDKLAPYSPVVIDMVQADWAKGFDQFVENTLKPAIEAGPAAPAAAPTVAPSLIRK